MSRPRSTTAGIDLAERARFFRCDEMTVRRWIAAGADVYDLESVGTLLLKQRNVKCETLDKTITELEND